VSTITFTSEVDGYTGMTSVWAKAPYGEAHFLVGTGFELAKYLNDPSTWADAEMAARARRHRNKPVAYIGSIDVIPVMRGAGHGHALLDAVLAKIDAVGVKETFLFAYSLSMGRGGLTSSGLIAWYARHGFKLHVSKNRWHPSSGMYRAHP
jgi:GNAT superfamily N-acetyltransferase